MSSLLYRLGRWAYRARRLVLAVWVGVLVVVGAGAGLLGGSFATGFSIPGTESQDALDTLSHNFPQVSGSSAQIVVVVPDGAKVRDAGPEKAVARSVDSLEGLDGVSAVANPLVPISLPEGTPPEQAEEAASLSDDSNVSDSGQAAIITVQLDDPTEEVPASLRDQLVKAGESLRDDLPAGSTVQVGGEAFTEQSDFGFSLTEVIGLVVAMIVLFAMFRSFVAAGLPLLTAGIGVMLTMAGVQFATGFADITSTAPALALMLGLAVGIDYTLFVLSRHVGQLRDGMDPEESVARAVATAGSAVVFAGLTVIIALVGLSVVNIPFLTVMGVVAALGVAVAVLICLTLTPALLGFASPLLLRVAAKAGSSATKGGTVGSRVLDAWVRAVTRWPVVTIAAVVVVVGLMTLPALSLRLALPDAGSQAKGTAARDSYDLIAQEFGPGFNGPLLITGSIVTSDDPLGLMADLKKELAAVDGVKAVPLATPNEDATTGIVQVIPDSAPDSDQTRELVQRIRDLEPTLQEKYGVQIAVTGLTAAGIDVSGLLGDALLPFLVLIIGLSLVLLTMVFRSIWVPVKATLGFLFSIGAAFGAVSAVFSWGWFSGPLHVVQVGPVISFMPILLIGVLFGLAMDYEVFLVSRIREEYVHGASATEAIRKGFRDSGQVVSAAAAIMISVFAAFVPHGDANIKPIALGLTVGVLVDAFIVRMVLVPAVLQLLGDRAWWIPRWLDRRLPSFDVEGEGVTRELALAEWPGDGSAIAASALGFQPGGAGGYRDVDLTVMAGEILVIEGEHHSGKSALAYTLAGRVQPSTGRLRVAGYVLPQRSAAVRSRVGLLGMSDESDPAGTVRWALSERPQILVIDDLDDVTDPAVQRAVQALLDQSPVTLVVTCVQAESIEQALPPDRVTHVHRTSAGTHAKVEVG